MVDRGQRDGKERPWNQDKVIHWDTLYHPPPPAKRGLLVSIYEYVVLHAVRERTNITYTLN
jgi:hypothetical protein